MFLLELNLYPCQGIPGEMGMQLCLLLSLADFAHTSAHLHTQVWLPAEDTEMQLSALLMLFLMVLQWLTHCMHAGCLSMQSVVWD